MQIAADYGAGRLLTGEVKKILIDTLNPMIQAHQVARKLATDEVVHHFMSVRPLDFVKPTPGGAAGADGAGGAAAAGAGSAV